MLPDSPWFIASISKLFIAAVVMQMTEEGELALADRLVDLLPEPLTEGLHRMGGQDHTPRITVEHLLSHTSGLPDFIEDYPARDRRGKTDSRSLVEILVQDGDREWSLEDTVERTRRLLRPHFPPQSLTSPGVRLRYSDTNYQLLVGIVEAQHGKSFAEVLAERVLDPLDLASTWVPGHPRGSAVEPNVATLYAGADTAPFPQFFRSIVDLNSTCPDLIRFLRGLRNDGENGLFRDPDTWSRMHGRRWRFAFPRDRAALRQPSWPIEYGLGVMGFRLPRLLTPFRPVPGVLGHTGSTGTWLFHAPDPDLYLVGAVSQITAGALPFRLVPKILRAASRATGSRP